jgi:hypothetical protein
MDQGRLLMGRNGPFDYAVDQRGAYSNLPTSRLPSLFAEASWQEAVLDLHEHAAEKRKRPTR